jgi:hypothetical protein
MKKLLNNILQKQRPQPRPFLSREFFLSRESLLIACISSEIAARCLPRSQLPKRKDNRDKA